MEELKVYLNGQIVEAGRAGVSVFDEGFLHGASVFTTMRAHRGKVFRLDRHLSRMIATAGLLGLSLRAEAGELSEAVAAVLEANGLAEARVRVTLTPGFGERPTALVTAQPMAEYPRWWYEKGVKTVVSSFRQGQADPTVGNKTGCYLTRVLGRQEAASKGAEEALWYTPDNRLAEACFCNVFLVVEGQVLTPPRDTPVLPGIAREAVLEICRAEGIGCDDGRALTVREMLAAGEIFLTGSLTGVRPVVQVEGHVVGEGVPGDLTRRLMKAYEALVEKECAG